MTRRITSLLLAATFAVPATFAYVLSPQEALGAATSGGNAVLKKAAQTASANPVMTLSANGQPTVYLFSGPEGSIVASAESGTPSLLGYTDKTALSEADLPETLKYWLEFYNQEIDQLRAGKTVRYLSVESTADFTPIEPMLTCKWNQGQPYNASCPDLNGYKCVTGCVATGMAQAMFKHKWPEQGRGSISYEWRYGGETLSLDFSESTYNWDLILPDYSGSTSRDERRAVAALMRDCGYSVQMNYSPYASGAIDAYIPLSLYKYFDYSKGMRYESRFNFFASEWEKMVYGELAAGRPVIYCGSGASGGHCFVCDGYSSEGYFHFNWGWGGVSDGYFLLSALAPGVQGIGGNDDNFNSNQSIVTGMRKPEPSDRLGVVISMDGPLNPRYNSYSGNDPRFGGSSFVNYSVEKVSGSLGVKLIPDSGGEPEFAEGTEVDLTTITDGSYYAGTLTVPFENWPKEGEYTVMPAFLMDGEWYDVEMDKSLPERLHASISGGTITFSRVAGPVQVEVTDVDFTSPLYAGKPFSLDISLDCKGAGGFYDNFILLLCASGTEDVVDHTDDFDVNLKGDTESVRSLNTQWLDNAAAGKYDFYILDQYSRIYYGPVTVELEEAPSEEPEVTLTDFKVTSAKSQYESDGKTFNVVDPSDIRTEATLSCTQGYFTSAVNSYIFPISGGTSLGSVGSCTKLLGAGQTGTLTFEGTYDGATDGTEYMIGFFTNNNAMQFPGVIYIRADKSGAVSAVKAENLGFRVEGNTLMIDDATTEGAIYSADGKQVMKITSASTDISALSPGVYLIVTFKEGKPSSARIIR